MFAAACSGPAVRDKVPVVATATSAPAASDGLPDLPPLSPLPLPADAEQASCGDGTVEEAMRAIASGADGVAAKAAGCPTALVALIEARWATFDVRARLTAIRALAANGGAFAWHGLLFALESPGLEKGCEAVGCDLEVIAARAVRTSETGPPGDRVVAVAKRLGDPSARSVLYRAAGDSGQGRASTKDVISRLRAAAAWEASAPSLGGPDAAAQALAALEKALGRAEKPEPPVWIQAALVKLGDSDARQSLVRAGAKVEDFIVLDYIADARLLHLTLPLLDGNETRTIFLGGHVPSIEYRVKDRVVDLAARMGLVRVPPRRNLELFPQYDDALIAETRRAILAQPPP